MFSHLAELVIKKSREDMISQVGETPADLSSPCFIRSLALLIVFVVTWVMFLSTSFGFDDEAAKIAFFEAKIRPVLIEHCYECHSAEASLEGNLGLDSRSALLAGGDRGAAIVPGDSANSLLMQAIRWTDPNLKMPPEDSGHKLTENQIADFQRWIDDGAVDPRIDSSTPVRKSWDEKFQERLDWWSLRPVQRHATPTVSDQAWSENDIDSFLLDSMHKKGLEPAPIADANTLIRRATLVLTGLPPKPDEVTRFADAYRKAPNQAYVDLVDKLLASDAFGERFCKHWLDVVRFTETHGNEWNYDVPYAYRYRDYMIRAINSDLPFDQWIREHIAGDLLDSPRRNVADKFNESAIGTAFFRFGEANHDSCTQFPIIGYDIADNQVDTLTKAFQATTVSCARCHDHKLDAISTKDYHAFLGIIRSSRSVQRTLNDPETNRDVLDRLSSIKREIRAELAQIWAKNAESICEESLSKASKDLPTKDLGLEHPLSLWRTLQLASESGEELEAAWKSKANEFSKESSQRKESNSAKFELLYDLRDGLPHGWSKDGIGLRSTATVAPDFIVAHEGDTAIRSLVPRGLFTHLLSDKMNGALRSPVLPKTQGKVSFEVIGGNFSLARVVFNNCQLNYDQQHSIHHPDWTWVTVNVPDGAEKFYPYAELLTYWDNPKFPDPLGTLGKDTENQRLPYADHSKNPRTWFGIRRIVTHREAGLPQDEMTYLARLYDGPSPGSLQQLADRYRTVTCESLKRFMGVAASDDDVRWLDAMIKAGLLENRADASPGLKSRLEEYRDVENHQLSLPMTMAGMADEWDGFNQPILSRGDFAKPGDSVARRFLQALDPKESTVVSQGSGRRMLADAIADKSNPLTARVFVNRVWHWSFGQGIVRTPDDFGHLGDQPSHPELLDALATEFMDSGWSLKKLLRNIVLSRTFQLSSAQNDQARELDPQNRWLSHYPARRVEAEVIRDSLLAVSTRLNPTMYGPSVHPYREKADTEKRLYVGPLDGDGRRSLYLKVQLMEAPRFLSAFNLPGGKVTQGRRDTSNVPAQSLAMLNDPFVWAMAEHWSKRLVADGSDSISARIEGMFLRALGRMPTEAERSRMQAAAYQFAKLLEFSPLTEASILSSESVWKNMAHAMFNMKEFIYVP